MTEKPKRPLSAYMIWLGENREKLKKEFPGIKVTEIAKKGGELWRGLKDKSEWERKAAERKNDYVKAVKHYEDNGGTDTGKKRGKASKKTGAKRSKKKNESEESGEESE